MRVAGVLQNTTNHSDFTRLKFRESKAACERTLYIYTCALGGCVSLRPYSKYHRRCENGAGNVLAQNGRVPNHPSVLGHLVGPGRPRIVAFWRLRLNPLPVFECRVLSCPATLWPGYTSSDALASTLKGSSGDSSVGSVSAATACTRTRSSQVHTLA